MLIALYWLLSSLGGVLVTGRNGRLAWRRWSILRRNGVRESLVITAFVTVRSDAIRLYQHLCYLLLGVRVFVPHLFAPLSFGVATMDLHALVALRLPFAVPPVLVVPLTIDVVLLLFLMIPTLLIVASQTGYADSERALHLEKQ